MIFTVFKRGFVMLKRLFKKLYHSVYLKLFGSYQIELEKAVGKCVSLLDIGCGSSSPIKYFSKKLYCVGVDSFEPSIEKSKRERIHNDYYKIDVLDIDKEFKPNSFDCVVALDLIEHLTKEDGNKLIDKMEVIAKEKVVIFTPNGLLPQGEWDNNPWQVHKSGWSTEEMRKRGYDVIGINGWKPLRGEYTAVRFWPKYLWLIISDVTQFFVKNRPEKACQLLCYKCKEA
jgi:SAM-dependent methyltransferase